MLREQVVYKDQEERGADDETPAGLRLLLSLNYLSCNLLAPEKFDSSENLTLPKLLNDVAISLEMPVIKLFCKIHETMHISLNKDEDIQTMLQFHEEFGKFPLTLLAKTECIEQINAPNVKVTTNIFCDVGLQTIEGLHNGCDVE